MLALVKATVNLPGLSALRVAYADVDDPKIMRFLKAQFVVFVDPEQELEWLERQHRGEEPAVGEEPPPSEPGVPQTF